MIGEARFHRRSNAKAGMHAAEVVVREVQGDSSSQVLPLFRERIGEPRQSANLHSHREVLPFNV